MSRRHGQEASGPHFLGPRLPDYATMTRSPEKEHDSYG
jgi:hypothetical protein